MPRLLAVLIVLIGTMSSAPDAALAQAGELAFVQPDGTLKLGNRTIRLYGIYMPPTDRFCRTFLRPPRCASRAVLELDRMIHGFVWCDPALFLPVCLPFSFNGACVVPFSHGMLPCTVCVEP